MESWRGTAAAKGAAAAETAAADVGAQRIPETVRGEIAENAAREAGSATLGGSVEAELRLQVQQHLPHRGARSGAAIHAPGCMHSHPGSVG